jgi:hypothetical protein
VGGENPVTTADPDAPRRTGRRRRGGFGVAAAVAGTVGVLGTSAGCGIQSTGLKVVGSAPTVQEANVTGSDSAENNGQYPYEIYFFRNGKLTPVLRSTDQNVTPEFVLTEVIKGPNATDQSDGFTSDIPSSLTIVSLTAGNQQWNYRYSQPLDDTQRAEIVCSMQADADAPNVGTLNGPDNEIWNSCTDFEYLGAPAYLPNLGASAATSPGLAGN